MVLPSVGAGRILLSRLAPTMRLLLLVLAVVVSACDTADDDGPIVRYTGPAITEADATVPNDPFGPAGWTGTVFSYEAGRSVSVSRSVLCGDECNWTTTLRFEGRGALPTSVEGTVLVRTATPESFEEMDLEIDRVEIQDWGPDAYSGIVYLVSRPDIDTRPIVFWADELAFATD